MLMDKNFKNKRAIVLILSILFISIFILVFLFTAIDQYFSLSNSNRHYENNLRLIYLLEAGRRLCEWELSQAQENWDTIASDATLPSNTTINGSYIDNEDFYRVIDLPFRAKVYNDNGTVRIYVHAFLNNETDSANSRYLEYIYPRSPLYKFAVFTHGNISFSGGGVWNYSGGRVHTNSNIYFSPKSDGIRINQIGELSANGTITYAGYYSYPLPSDLDKLDGKIDGMSPAPALPRNRNDNVKNETTTGDNVIPGQFRYFSTDGRGWDIYWKSYGDWMASWGWDNQVSYPWRGYESYFYGRQFNGSGHFTSEESTYTMDKDGNIISWQGQNKANIINIYYDYSSDSLKVNNLNGTYYSGNVYFRPAKDKEGNPNENWFSIPGALPEEYSWSKYRIPLTDDRPVEFYVTEKCNFGDSGCFVDPGPFNFTVGWRYQKQRNSEICTDNDCYNADDSTYIKIQDWKNIKGGRDYFGNINASITDRNEEFFEDYVYGNDVNDTNSQYRKIKVFNPLKQLNGFSNYLDLLSQNGIEGVIRPGVSKKDIDLQVFPKREGEETIYIKRANESGLYIPKNEDEVNTLINRLNSGNLTVARKVTFYNWKSNSPVTLVDIDIGNFTAVHGNNFNGIIYSKFPIRLSNASVLPSSPNKKKSFTLISEESVYLKGNFNYVPDNPATNNNEEDENWQPSHIITKKKLYTLSNAFNDPQQPPDFAIYPTYPYVYVRVERDANGNITNYYKEEGNPSINNGVWVNADAVFSEYNYYGGYKYYPGMDTDTRIWVRNKRNEKQTAWEDEIKSGIKTTINKVDGNYTYNSLFIFNYDWSDGDTTLEDWTYNGTTYRRTMKGAFFNLYLEGDANYSVFAVPLTPNENTWNYRRVLNPDNSWYIRTYGGGGLDGQGSSTFKTYDPRFPDTISINPEAVIGVSSDKVWRLVSKEYYCRNVCNSSKVRGNYCNQFCE